jgi:biopolymer transport protein ExbD
MRLSKHRRKTSAVMDMTPMIDITFQLMIFFMTCTQVSQVNKEKIDLPRQKGSAEQQENTTLTINVDEAGEIKVSGNPYTVAELVALVGNELEAAGGEPSRVRVSLRASRNGTCRTVNEVVGALRRQNINHVNIAVQE